MTTTPHISAVCHFCEDIRQEMAGQVSLIGIYPSAIYMPSFPVLIPKFAMFVTAMVPFHIHAKSVSARMTSSWGRHEAMEALRGLYPNGRSGHLKSSGGDFFSLQFRKIIPGITIPSEGTMEVIFSCNDEHIVAGHLSFRPASERLSRNALSAGSDI